MDKEALYFKLEAFLDGKLSESESREMQQQIDSQEEVAEQLSLLLLERELADLMIDKELDAKMNSWSAEKEQRLRTEGNGAEKKDPNGDSPPKGRNRWWLGLLFGALVLTAIGIWQLFPSEPPVDDPLSNETPLEVPNGQPAAEESQTADPAVQEEAPENSTPMVDPSPRERDVPSNTPTAPERPVAQDPAATVPDLRQLAVAEAARTAPVAAITSRATGPETAPPSPITQGRNLIAAGKLEDAIRKFETVPQENEEAYLNAQQYLAYIFFEQQKFEKAIPILESLTAMSYYDLERMNWCLALAYLATGQQEKGVTLAKTTAANAKSKGIREAAGAFLQKIGER